MKRITQLLFPLVIVCGNSSTKADEALSRYTWDDVPMRAYYIGKLERGSDDKVSFRTRDTKIYVKGDAKVTVKAIDHNHTLILDVPIRRESLEVPADPPPKIEVEVPLTEEQKMKVAQVQALHVERAKAFEIAPYRYLDFALLIGSEHIIAEGGLTHFDGSSRVGGAAIKYTVHNNDTNREPWSPNRFSFRIDTHSFSTVEVVTQNTYVEPNKTVVVYRRLSGRLVFLYEIPLPGEGHWLLGPGIGMFEMPFPEIKDSSGEAGLKDRLNIGLAFSTLYEYPLTEHLRLYAALEMIPFVLLGKVKSGRSLFFDIGSDYFVTPNLYGMLGLRMGSEGGTVANDCSISTNPGCVSKGTSTSRLTVFSLGIGFLF